MENKINAFHRRIDNAKLFNGLGKRTLEEFIVKFNDNFLLALGTFNAFGTEFHALVKIFKASLIDIIGSTFHYI
ncbi:MAG: hypothetical protein II835_17800, partial [Fibrobacter sp.]|nr:hypothetical protein [Fibrobacter sp.]